MVRTSKDNKAQPFSPAWIGPRRVISQITDVLYEVDMNGFYAFRHIDDLRRAPPGNRLPDEDPSSSDDDDESDRPSSAEPTSDSSEPEATGPVQFTVPAQIHLGERMAARTAEATVTQLPTGPPLEQGESMPSTIPEEPSRTFGKSVPDLDDLTTAPTIVKIPRLLAKSCVR